MFLSQMWLSPTTRTTLRDLSDCQRLHKRVMSAFETVEHSGRRQLGVLHRAEVDPRSGRVRLLVQSQSRPDWSVLPEEYLEGQEPVQTKPVDSIYDSLQDGSLLRFRLRANTTRRVGNSEHSKARGRRVPLRGEEARLEWIHRKGEQHGFCVVGTGLRPDVPDVQVVEEPEVRGWKVRDGVKRRLTFASTLYEGRLRIIDAARFRKALEVGVGPAKAYGFGLLSVAPDA